MISVPEFMRPLERVSQPFPLAAVEEVEARWEESRPHLIAALEWTAAHMEEVAKDEGFVLADFAMHLCAQFRETGAYEPLLKIVRHPLAVDYFDDGITYSLPKILASVSGGDPKPLQAIVEDESLDEFIRSAALQALGALLQHGMLERAYLVNYMTDLYRERLVKDDSFVWSALVGMSADLRFQEHLDAIRSAYEDGLADPYVEPLERIEKRLRRDPNLGEDTMEYDLLDDTISEMSRWFCFHESPETEAFLEEDEDLDFFDDDDTIEEDTFSGLFPPFNDPVPDPSPAPPKIGRNEPCPCQSGKKYKKCCGRK